MENEHLNLNNEDFPPDVPSLNFLGIQSIQQIKIFAQN